MVFALVFSMVPSNVRRCRDNVLYAVSLRMHEYKRAGDSQGAYRCVVVEEIKKKTFTGLSHSINRNDRFEKFASVAILGVRNKGNERSTVLRMITQWFKYKAATIIPGDKD